MNTTVSRTVAVPTDSRHSTPQHCNVAFNVQPLVTQLANHNVATVVTLIAKFAPTIMTTRPIQARNNAGVAMQATTSILLLTHASVLVLLYQKL